VWPQGIVVVRVKFANGITGIGYAEDGIGAATTMVNCHLAQLCLGMDGMATESIFELLFRASIVYGRKGAAIEAISAIDIALWDAIGKSLDLPVYRLLGGHSRGPVRAYASKVQPDDNFDVVRRAARDYVDRGYAGVKANLGYGPSDGRRGMKLNLKHLETIRNEIGDEIELMTDAYMGWDRQFSRQMAKSMSEFELTWLEEPLIPDDVEGHAWLRSVSDVPIATGEHEFTRYGFQTLIDAGAADYLQPDVHRVGGLTEFRRICHMASGSSIDVVPHVYSAATLHGVLSQPNCHWIEHLTNPTFWDSGERLTPLFTGEPKIINGNPEMPVEPGIGIRLNPEAIPEMADWLDA
jgi:L-alanine-DL-glutamate epimerase-like enolase superfamily enzyme